MLQVKIFDEEHEADLEEAVNEFLKEIDETFIKDIQYRVAASSDGSEDGQLYCFSVMILYYEYN